MKIHKLWQDYPDLAKELAATLKMMEGSIKLSNKAVEQAILTMIYSGGKLLRPAYLLLFSQFGKETDREKMIALAAAMETLHTATLIHDDIIDEADLRRNHPTVQSQFGKDVAVYAGDYLFVSCFKLLANHASSLKSIQLNANSMEKVLAGELGQMDNRYDTTMSINAYLDNISGKTAELFALSCFVGAYESGCSQLFANKCKKIGNYIGITFQIIDDILDYTSDAETLGKNIGDDLMEGKPTLPLISALQKTTAEEHDIVRLSIATGGTAQLQRVIEIVQNCGALEYCRQRATEETQAALEALDALPNTPYRQALVNLTQLALNRIQ